MLLYRIPCVLFGLLLLSLSAGDLRADAPAISPGRNLLSWTGCTDETDVLWSSSHDEMRSRRHSGTRWRWEDGREFIVRYNRVEGPFIAWRLPHAYDRYREAYDFGLYSEVGYGLKSTDWRYQIGVEFSAFSSLPRETSYRLMLGTEFHDLTDTQDAWIIPQWENSLAAFLFKKDSYDFYRRSGWSIYLTQRFGGVLQLTGRFQSDDFESLLQHADWSLFGDEDFRDNPAADEGRINSLRGELRIDTRDGRRSPSRGWLIDGLAERAGGDFEGDYEFERYRIDVRRYQPLRRYERIDLRFRAGTSTESLPSQYFYDLGGLSTLRGYDFKEFTGDRMLLVNVEYRVNAERRWGDTWIFDDYLQPLVFFDAGAAWSEGESLDTEDVQKSAGLAFASENDDLRISFAKPLDKDDHMIAVSLRVSRPF